MSEPKLISPMLDNYIMGSPISEHHGVCCCPAIENGTEDRYIIKVISVPASPAQLDALLLTGAYPDKASALKYFLQMKDEILQEVDTLEKLSELEGFLPYSQVQVVPMESEEGFDIYLKRSYKRSLQKHFTRHSFTHLDALNLGLDLCAALGVCRRSGYMYVDLKPSNVFVTDQRLFRIGDLGFIRLSSLKYASLPEKYQSIYTPPEVRDAFSSLNDTMDVYAAGLILYQTYNNGQLPFNSEIQPGDTLPAPLYADYEMSEIILKACAPNPEDRWADPMQMGQAIVSYMQRNGASDTPIVPMPVAESEEEEAVTEIDSADIIEEAAEIAPEEPDTAEDDVVTQEDASEISEESPEESDDIPQPVSEETIEDEIPFEEDDSQEELADYEEVTEEVSEMLEQADVLAAMDVPEPVVVPEHVDVPVPEPVTPEEEETEDTEETEVTVESDEPEKEIAAEEQPDDSEPLISDSLTPDEDIEAEPAVKKTRHWLRNTILILVALALLAGGIYYYTQHYLLPIDFIAVEGNEDTLTVFVTTDIDESLLQVVCSDTYGNQIPAPVINGKAEFTALNPNTAYSIKVVAKGFHRLTGQSSTAYSTPVQTNIIQFDAVTGATEDSVILSFTVEGPDSKEWTVVYSTEGEEVRTATFTSHMVTLTGLTVGRDYSFQLVPSENLFVSGQDSLVFTTRKLIKAENLQITGCINNTLTVEWAAPADTEVASWYVHCFNDAYNQTLTTTELSAVFEDIDPAAEYTVEVKAAGMSVGQTTSVAANSVTAADFTVDTTDHSKLVFTWQPSQAIPEGGWILRYTVAGIENEFAIPCTDNSVTIAPVIPNATYRVQLQDIKGNVLLGSKKEILTGEPVDFQKQFSNFTAKREDLEFSMCRTPSRPGWGRYDLSSDDYTSTFVVGQSASFLVRFQKLYNAPSEDVSILYVIRNQDGTPIYSGQQLSTWKEMWPLTYCKLTIPMMPAVAGSYTVEVYFNGGLAHQQSFTVA